MRNQKGMTFASMAAVLALIALLGKAAFTLVPMYWDDKMIGTIMNKMQESGEVRETTKPSELKRLIQQRLYSNDLTIDLSQLKISEEKRGLVVDWPYEARGTWIGEIDLVVRFHQYKEF